MSKSFQLPPAWGRSDDHWYAQYLETEHWSQVRKFALERARHRCQLCNSPDNLHVHHRNYSRLGSERPDDVTVLCQQCHEVFHQNRKVVNTGKQEIRMIGVIGHILICDPTPPSRRTELRVFIRTASGEIHVQVVSYALHSNGSPHGGSRYRELWEKVLGRVLRRGETFDPYDLVGRKVEIAVVSYPDHPDIPRRAWITRALDERVAV